MAIAKTAPHIEESIGGQPRRLLLRNSEIERFEAQYAPLGMFELFDQLTGRARAPQVRHVRDLVALGLVGGGMSDRAADDLIAGLQPSENRHLLTVAQRLVAVTFLPSLTDQKAKKHAAGSRKGAADQPTRITTPEIGSETLSASSPD